MVSCFGPSPRGKEARRTRGGGAVFFFFCVCVCRAVHQMAESSWTPFLTLLGLEFLTPHLLRPHSGQEAVSWPHGTLYRNLPPFLSSFLGSSGLSLAASRTVPRRYVQEDAWGGCCPLSLACSGKPEKATVAWVGAPPPRWTRSPLHVSEHPLPSQRATGRGDAANSLGCPPSTPKR